MLVVCVRISSDSDSGYRLACRLTSTPARGSSPSPTPVTTATAVSTCCCHPGGTTKENTEHAVPPYMVRFQQRLVPLRSTRRSEESGAVTVEPKLLGRLHLQPYSEAMLPPEGYHLQTLMNEYTAQAIFLAFVFSLFLIPC